MGILQDISVLSFYRNECVILSELTLCRCQDVKIPELSYLLLLIRLLPSPILGLLVVLMHHLSLHPALM